MALRYDLSENLYNDFHRINQLFYFPKAPLLNCIRKFLQLREFHSKMDSPSCSLEKHTHAPQSYGHKFDYVHRLLIKKIVIFSVYL